MPFYHVRITEKSSRSGGEFKLDLTLEELERRILSPYSKGQQITIAGKSLSVNEIDRIRINKTDEKSEALRATAQQRRRDSRVVKLFSVDWDIAAMGEEVTDEFITAPPGSHLEGVPVLEPRLSSDNRDVFVVHGRNTAARDAVFEFLGSLNLHPIEWAEAVVETRNPTASIPDIIEAAFARAHAVVVLFTPDDQAKLHPALWSENESTEETEPAGQARPNVLFEAGMAMARHPERTVLVELGKLRRFSDIDGIHTIRLNDSVARRQEFAQRLQMAGCPANLTGNRWHNAGRFEDVIASLSKAGHENEVSMNITTTATSSSLSLTSDAKSLLLAAVKDESEIVRLPTAGGLTIQTDNTGFSEVGNRLSEAKWDQALKELLNLGLVESLGGNDQVFKITYPGFQLADELDQSSDHP